MPDIMPRLLPFFLYGLAVFPVLGDEAVRFNQDIRPIFSKKCFKCHGPESKRKAHLRLDVANGEEGAYRVYEESQAIKGGDLVHSAVWQRITTDDPDEVMPPPDSHADAITVEERGLIKRWILSGAEYEDFWAFVPPREAALPAPQNTAWSDQPIDRFVLQRLEKAGLQASTRADKRSLIRRVSFDLSGLPPTREEIEAYLNDSSERAYETLVDGLLEKPQYGEHMAKYWLDLVRFADTNGLHHDHYREMTPYRDWVIRSFNDNLRFDEFISWQIAGDLYPEAEIDQQIASGFNRLHLIIDRGTALPEESFTRNVIDRVAAVGTAFLGLTLQCAVCHDHKFDPITQKDFYQLAAFFNNFDGGPETGGRSGSDFKRGLQPPYLNLPSPEQATKLEEMEEALAQLQAEVLALKAGPNQEEIKAATDRVARMQGDRDAHLMTIPGTLVMKERAEIRPAHILIRGAYDNPGEEVQRDTPGFLAPMEKGEGIKTRLDLAEWLVAPTNPLTARVAVNRFWQQFFGVGLVKTSEDFGAQGEWPSHPDLLDHLALQFVGSGWDVKSLVRAIVLSQTYQQSSAARRDQYLSDPENRLLARGPRFRLDSEMLRDQILAVSGRLNPDMYGKSVKPPQPEGLWKIVAMPSSYPRVYKVAEGDQIYRRSVYTFWKRGLPPPQMTIFDAPSRESCIARRERTNTPLQALLLMNEEQCFAAAVHLAHNLLDGSDSDDAQIIRTAYEMITSHLPDAGTMARLQDARLAFLELYYADPASAQAMMNASTDAGVRAITDPARQAELASWTMLVHSLLNLDSTKTRE